MNEFYEIFTTSVLYTFALTLQAGCWLWLLPVRLVFVALHTTGHIRVNPMLPIIILNLGHRGLLRP